MKWSIPSMMVARSPTYFLETFPGAAVAYSLRKLRTPQVYAIRVRRDSDNAEQDIGFSGGGLDVVSLAAFVGSNSGYIKTWYDQSGNSRDGTTPSNSAQPRIVNAGTIDRDAIGNICCVFDGVDDQVNSGYTNLTNWSNIAVLQSDATVAANSPMINQNTGMDLGVISVAGWGISTRQDVGYIVADGNLYQTGTLLPPISTSTNFIAFESWDNSAKIIKYRMNGNDATDSGVTGTTLRNGSGGEVFLPGKAFEAIIYPTSQYSNRVAIEAAINSYYHIF